MEKVSRVRSVRELKARDGNIRFVTRDEEGEEYSTSDEAIGSRAKELEGRLARIEYHEALRDGSQNVYLDGIEPVDNAGEAEFGDREAEEAAWKIAVAAAPYLIGERKRALKPEDLFARLKLFKDLVADDIPSDDHSDPAQ
jgi:hypothetical protein